jgi:nitrate reductase cytochrome c-type subunit
MRFLRLAAIGLVLISAGVTPAVSQTGKSPADTFATSLHAARTGKHHFYSKETGGFETLTGVPMALDCTQCHAPTLADGTKVDAKTYKPGCLDCHKTPGDKVADATCLSCHSRQALEMKVSTDVHHAKGMTCMSCHTKREMHGDGKRYVSQNSPGAMDAKCESCHSKPVANAAHQAHGGKLDCKACHTQSVIACNSCHFDSQVAGGGRRFFQPPMTNFLLLVRREGSGKVHPATMQTLTYKGKSFVVIASYSAHTIAKQARACGDCHGNANVQSYAKTGKIAVTQWDAQASRLSNATGVVPVPPDWRSALMLDFMTYTGNASDPKTDPNAWAFLKSGTDLQQMLFAQPLTKEQMEKLKQNYGK